MIIVADIVPWLLSPFGREHQPGWRVSMLIDIINKIILTAADVRRHDDYEHARVNFLFIFRVCFAGGSVAGKGEKNVLVSIVHKDVQF